METPVSPSRSLVQMTELILPNHMNALGTAFGGVIMSWIDIAASISASRYCSKNVVTASIDDLHFLAPVHKGDVVCLKAQVNYTHKTSMEVGVHVTAENPRTQKCRHTVTAYLTFVALDESYKPTLIPPLLLETEEEKQRFKQAEMRRKWRLERRKQFI
jgi:acyl-CoA hydrolase